MAELSPEDRYYLARALERHPGAAKHIKSLAAIDRMPLRSLLSLASKLGVDPASLVKAQRDEDTERHEHTTKHPAFAGTLAFDLTFEVLGRRIKRKAKAEYTYTPEWEYFDRHKNQLHVGWPGSGLSIKVRVVRSKDGDFGGDGWEEVEILNVGEIWDVLDAEIEKRSKAEDTKRRKAAKRRGATIKPLLNGPTRSR